MHCSSKESGKVYSSLSKQSLELAMDNNQGTKRTSRSAALNVSAPTRTRRNENTKSNSQNKIIVKMNDYNNTVHREENMDTKSNNSKFNLQSTSTRTFFTLPLDKILEFLYYDSYLALTTTCTLIFKKSLRDDSLKSLGQSLSQKWINIDLQWDTRTRHLFQEHKWVKKVMPKISNEKDIAVWKSWKNMGIQILDIGK